MPKPTAIDLLLISRYDSIYTYPVKMKDEFKKAQKDLTDSTEFYKLDLFVGLCFYLQGNADSALYLNQKVLDFCDRYPGTSALKANAWNHRSTLLQGVKKILPLLASTMLTMQYTSPTTAENYKVFA